MPFIDPTLTRNTKPSTPNLWERAKLLFWSTVKNPRLLAMIILGGVGVLLLIAVITYIVFANSLATQESIINRKNSGLIFYDRDGEEFYRAAGARDTTIIPLESIPDQLEQATIAIEDNNFYEHGGFSIQGYIRAIVTNIKLADPTAVGGSTITQQLVKNALLSQEKSFLRKFQELVLSIEIDRRFSKDEILELYLTSTYYGSGAYGVEEAANTYFGKTMDQLDLAEMAMLAGLPQAPSAYSPLSGNEELAQQRQRQVLEQMAQQGYITEEEATAAIEQEMSYNPNGSEASLNKAPHFVEYITDILAKKFGEDRIVRSGFKVYTTLDIQLQNTAQQQVKAQIDRLQGSGANNGALVALDPNNGEMLAMVGSADYSNNEIQGKFNFATGAQQPGSTTKPFVYLRSFEEGYTPASILHDKPTDFGGGYEPQNADRRFRGDVTVRRALGNSLNIPAVEMLRNVGTQDFIDTLQEFGVENMSDESARNCGLAIVLGCAEMPLTDLTRAFATLASEGVRYDMKMYTRIVDKTGKQVYPSQSFGLFGGSGNAVGKRVADRAYTYLISDILSDNSARSETFGANSPLRLSRPASVKTGTTDESRDAWTVGYTPQIVVGVWVGNSDNRPMSLAGATGAAPIWQQVMESYLQGKPVQEFTRPNDVVQLPVCRGTEAVAEEEGTNTFFELFAKAHIPKDKCNAKPSPTPTPTPTPQSSESGTPDDEDERRPTPTPTPTPTHTPTQTPTPTPTPTDDDDDPFDFPPMPPRP